MFGLKFRVCVASPDSRNPRSLKLRVCVEASEVFTRCLVLILWSLHSSGQFRA
jgi:hypothetical protein